MASKDTQTTIRMGAEEMAYLRQRYSATFHYHQMSFNVWLTATLLERTIQDEAKGHHVAKRG